MMTPRIQSGLPLLQAHEIAGSLAGMRETVTPRQVIGHMDPRYVPVQQFETHCGPIAFMSALQFLLARSSSLASRSGVMMNPRILEHLAKKIHAEIPLSYYGTGIEEVASRSTVLFRELRMPADIALSAEEFVGRTFAELSHSIDLSSVVGVVHWMPHLPHIPFGQHFTAVHTIDPTEGLVVMYDPFRPMVPWNEESRALFEGRYSSSIVSHEELAQRIYLFTFAELDRFVRSGEAVFLRVQMIERGAEIAEPLKVMTQLNWSSGGPLSPFISFQYPERRRSLIELSKLRGAEPG